MRQVAGVHHEIRREPEAVDLVDRLDEGAGDARVGGSGEPDVAVADLGEPQGGPGLGLLRPGRPCDMGDHLTAGHGQHHRGPKPRRVANQQAARHRVRIALAGHGVTTTVPWMNG